jgi:hypothetical protein
VLALIVQGAFDLAERRLMRGRVDVG